MTMSPDERTRLDAAQRLGSAQEREAVVRWLRVQATKAYELGHRHNLPSAMIIVCGALREVAGRIERREHLPDGFVYGRDGEES